MSDIYTILPTLGPMHRILEIGCSRMVDTARLRALFPAAEIHCFEPDPRTVGAIVSERLEAKLNVSLHPCALSDRTGWTDFYLSTTNSKAGELHTDSSSIRKPVSCEGVNAYPDLRFDPRPVKVFSAMLDSFALWPVDFVWMDAQAAEDLIILGGLKTFESTRYLHTEHCTDGAYENEPGFDGIKKMLPGWTVEQLWPVDVLLKNPAH